MDNICTESASCKIENFDSFKIHDDSETYSIVKEETIKTEVEIEPELWDVKEEGNSATGDIKQEEDEPEYYDKNPEVNNDVKDEQCHDFHDENFGSKVLMSMDLLKKGNKRSFPNVMFKCSECGYVPEKQTKKEIKLHMASHRDSLGLKRTFVKSDTVDLTCTYCQKQFKAFSDLQRHLVQHTGERTWQCEMCSKTFGQKYHLTRHMETHTGVRKGNHVWHMCNICGKQFTSSRSRNVHELSHSGEFLYNCEHCNKGFNERSIMLKHIVKRHGGSYEYCCEKCNRGFMTSRALNTHKPICGVQKPKKEKKIGVHPCLICNKIFNRKCNLERHIKAHNGEKEFMCNHCGKQYRDYRSVRNHTKKKHESCSSEWGTGVIQNEAPIDTKPTENNIYENT